ncbi:MAG: hypothetical protein H6624_15615 [Bdellovibrionaceae bacterium]|nr:hypothetical protein [Pseudobdellovibrionaceae bacterium]
MKRILTLILIGSVLSGCATSTKSVLMGMGTGAATGAIAGAALSQKDKGRNVAMSAAVMAFVGAIAGNLVHKGLEERDARVRKETLFNLEKFGVSGMEGTFDNNEGTHLNGKKLLIITDDLKWIKKGRQGE